MGVDDKVIDTEGTPDEGMVIDFSDLKQIMMDELDTKFDHNAVFYEKDQNRESLEKMNSLQTKKMHFVSFIPTAENLAKHWYGIIKPKLQEKGIKIAHVKIWETPTSTATYHE